MQINHTPSKILISGRSGCGKTTFFTSFIEKSQYNYKFIFDHEGEFSLRTKITCISTEQEFQEWQPREYTVFDPSIMFAGDLYGAFNFYNDWVFNISGALQGKKLFACDELQKLVATQKIEQELAQLIETGRRRGIDWVAVTQQPNLIHNRLRNQITEMVSFQQIDPRALKWFEEMGFNALDLRNLARGEYISLDIEGDYSFYTGAIDLSENSRFSLDGQGNEGDSSTSIETESDEVPAQAEETEDDDSPR
jgi:hypothetical protein